MVADGKPRRSRRDKGRGKGKGRTLPAEERPWHKAYAGPAVPKRTARKQERERRAREQEVAERAGRDAPPSGPGAPPPAGRTRTTPGTRRGAPSRDTPELVTGRNPVAEALRAEVPATTVYLAHGIDIDDRVNEIARTAADRRIAVLEVGRGELDRLTGGVPHQGVALQVPPYPYRHLEELLAAAGTDPAGALLVGLDGVTDPRNLGAVIRSAAGFGAGGVFLPARRSAGVTATAWRASAGAAARLPVARVTNLTRALKECQQAGFTVLGLDADGEHDLYDLPAQPLTGPVVLVVGSEGRGLSRLVGQTCDLRVAIPIAPAVESLNASVAAAVALAELVRRRR